MNCMGKFYLKLTALHLVTGVATLMGTVWVLRNGAELINEAFDD